MLQHIIGHNFAFAKLTGAKPRQNTTKRDHCSYFMMTSSNGNIFCVNGPLCREFTGPCEFPWHKGQWRGTLMFSLICVWINGWVNNHEAGDLRRYRGHYDVNVMFFGLMSGRWNMLTHPGLLLSTMINFNHCMDKLLHYHKMGDKITYPWQD